MTTPNALQLASRTELFEELCRRHNDVMLIVSDGPDDAGGNRCWWNGTPANLTWMMLQAWERLLAKYPMQGEEHE